jgi:hypothetical protein
MGLLWKSGEIREAMSLTTQRFGTAVRNLTIFWEVIDR